MRRPGIVTRSFAAATPRPAIQRASLPPVVVATAAPTEHSRQHRHDIAPPQIDQSVFRPGWLVLSRVWALFEAGLIGRQELDAAEAWRRWSEAAGPRRTQSWEPRIDRPLVPDDSVMLRRVAAATKLREAAAALGELRGKVLDAAVVRDTSWVELGRLLQCSDKSARIIAAQAIVALAAHLAGEPVPPPPLLRYRRNGAGA